MSGRKIIEGLQEAVVVAPYVAEIDRLTRENGALRTAFRVNMLRLGATHKEVEVVILAALTPPDPEKRRGE